MRRNSFLSFSTKRPKECKLVTGASRGRKPIASPWPSVIATRGDFAGEGAGQWSFFSSVPF